MSDHVQRGAAPEVDAVDAKLPGGRLFTLGLQHVLVMYAGAVAVPLIVGRALKLGPEQVAMLISADLFCCGLVTLIQSLGFGRWFGIKLPVMMGVTFAAVGPMVAMANVQGGPDGARAIFGAIIGAGVISIAIAPLMSRLLRFFPPVVTGTIIAIIGISLMRVGIGWAMGGPAPTAQSVDVPKLVAMVDQARAAAEAAAASLPPDAAAPEIKLPGPVPMKDNPSYGALDNMGVAAFVLMAILLMVRYAKGFVANIAVLLGIIIGCVVAAGLGKMGFEKVAKAPWFEVVTPFAFGMPSFDPLMILTMTLVMIVVMIESTGMFLALSEITGRKLGRSALSAGLRTDGLGTLIGGLFNTFPYTSFSQNVGLVGITGVRSRWVCVAAGLIMLVLGLLPKMAALVESIPGFVLGGAGLVMFGMVAATGVRILANVDFKTNRNNLYIVAISIGFGMIPLVAPRWTQQMIHGLHPLLESGILLTSISAVALNFYFNGGEADEAGTIAAARTAEAHYKLRSGTSSMKTTQALALAVLAGATLASGAAQAATWSDSFLGYRYGTGFREPSNTQEVRKHVLQFGHASGYAYGQNFVNLDLLQSDKNDPSSGADTGATEFYLTYRHQLHLGKLLDKDLSFGPVKEVALTGGFDLNTKNTAFAPRKRLVVAGPTLKFNVPAGFLDLSLLAGKEWNHCGLAFCTDHEHGFDTQWILSAAWGVPFQAGPLPLKFQGFINYNSEKGKDYSGVKTEAETLMRTSLMVDVGQMAAGRKNTLLMGVGYELWLNKFGNHATAAGVTKPGINTYAPTLQMEWHF